jgi:hypothetical protein
MQTRFRRGRIQFAALHLVPLVAALALFLVTTRAQAYPWMIRHGYTNCSSCHADPSGGELLNLYGHAISYEALSTRWGGNAEAARADQRRVARAIARAAHAKSAPKKRVAAENVNLDEEPAAKAAADEETGGDAPAEKKSAPDDEEAAEEEGAAEEGAAEETADDADAAKEAGNAASEPSPFQGMGLAGPLFGLLKPTEDLLLGGSFRLASTYRGETRFFPMQLDLYGQIRFLKSLRAGLSVGASKVPAGSPHARAAQVTREQNDGYNLISRTHWLGFDFGEGAHTIRAGRLNLPFGIRMSEHVMWVREKTQTDRESDQQHGVALYLGFETLRLEVMAIGGNFQINPDEFRERGYAGYAELVVDDKAAVGVSSLYTEAKNDRVYTEGLRTARGAHGVFTRVALSPDVSILAEANLLTRSRRELGYVGFFQIDVEPFSGFHLIGTGELLDAGYPKGGGPAGLERAKGVGKPEVGGWLSAQWFFLPHFDVRVDAVVRFEKMILSQLHVYL